MSNLVDLQSKLDQSRERFLEAVEHLSDEALMQPQAVGGYAVADVMALLTAWEAELITGLMRLDQGKKPGKLLAALADRTMYDNGVFRENHGRLLDQIFDDFQQVRMQLEIWLEAFSDSDLGRPKRYKWFRGKPLKQIVAETTYEMETAVIPQVAAFAQQWQSQQQENIPLTAVIVENDEHDNDDN